MKRVLCLTMFIVLLCSLSMAATTVAVPGDFASIEAAITANTSTGIHSAENVSYTINIDPSTSYTEQLCLNDADIGAGDIQAASFTIQSATPGTYAWVYLQKHPTATDDGIEIYTTATLTMKDIAFCPSQQAPVFTDEFIKIDKNGPSAATPMLFDHCLFTEIKADGTPMVTNRTEAYSGPPPTFGSSRTGLYPYIFQMWGEAGEEFDITLDDCVLYGNTQQVTIRIAPEANDTFTINNSLIAWGGNALVRAGSGSGNLTLNITGTDQTAGPDNCSVLYQPGGENHCIWISSGSVGELNVSNTILADGAGGISRGISGSGSCALTLADVIIDVPGPGVVDGADNAATWDRVTFAGPSNALYAVAGTGSLTATDCIFSGAGTKLAGSTPSGGYTMNNCAFPTTGADAITTIGLTPTLNNCIYDDPAYVSKDITSENYYDVAGCGYEGAGSGGSDLAGGADLDIQSFEFVYGPKATCYDLGDAVLVESISNSDLIEGVSGTIVTGGFHGATVGGVANLTNGVYDANGLSVIVADVSNVIGLSVEYDFSPATADIDEIVVFAGHDGDGSRAFINCVVEYDEGSGYVQLAQLLTGSYGTPSPGESVVSDVKVVDACSDMEDVQKLKLTFYSVSHNSTGFFQAWDDNTTTPPANYPNQGTILKEIDVLGTIDSGVEDWRLY